MIRGHTLIALQEAVTSPDLSALAAWASRRGILPVFWIDRTGHLSRFLSERGYYYYLSPRSRWDEFAHPWRAFSAAIFDLFGLAGFLRQHNIHAIVNALSVPENLALRYAAWLADVPVRICVNFDGLAPSAGAGIDAGRFTAWMDTQAACPNLNSVLATVADCEGRQGRFGWWWIRAFLFLLFALGRAAALHRRALIRACYGPVKRVIDVALCLLFLVLCLPALLGVSLWHVGQGRRFASKLSVSGRGNRPVLIHVFAPPPGLERASGYDCFSATWETKLWWLPALWNVLKGDLSFVGPRLVSYERLTDAGNEELNFFFRPGLTGWSQLNRGAASCERDLTRMDQLYTNTCGPLLDLKIALSTLMRGLKGIVGGGKS